MTQDKLFNQIEKIFNRNTLGTFMNPNMFKVVTNSSEGFPYYNIIDVSDTEVILELAVAGFTRDQIKIEIANDWLTIRGDKSNEDTRDYRYQGISTRNFSRGWKLSEFEVKDATMENGILTVRLEKDVPLKKEIKIIDIC